MAIEIVDLPIENGDFPWLFVCLPEGRSALPHLVILLAHSGRGHLCGHLRVFIGAIFLFFHGIPRKKWVSICFNTKMMVEFRMN